MWRYGPGLMERARDQLAGYLDRFKRLGDGFNTVPGTRYSAPGVRGVTVPDRYVPELAAVGIRLVLFTHHTISPGIVYYEFRQKDTRRKPTSEVIANMVYDIAARKLAWQFPNKNELRIRLAQVYQDEMPYYIRETVLNPVDDNGNVDKGNIVDSIVHNHLMKGLIPDYFYKSVPIPWPVPGADPKQSWDCPQLKCA